MDVRTLEGTEILKSLKAVVKTAKKTSDYGFHYWQVIELSIPRMESELAYPTPRIHEELLRSQMEFMRKQVHAMLVEEACRG